MNLRNAALRYSSVGWLVFPLAPRSKLPLISKKFGGNGCHDATTDEAQIRKWWDTQPLANIGLHCRDMLVVDIDPRHSGDETLATLEKERGELPLTIVSHTGSGGFHFLYKTNVPIKNSVGKLGPGVDIRAEGGFIVLPPSIHPNGRCYVWDVDRHPDDMPLTEAPPWLIAAAGSGEQQSNGAAKPKEPDFWRRLIAEGVGEGQRNDFVARLTGHFLRREIDPLVTLHAMRAINLFSCRPPLDDTEVTRTVASVLEAEQRRRSAA